MVAFALLAGACDNGGTSSGSPADARVPLQGGTFTVVLPQDPGNLDPQATLETAVFANAFAYDTLVTITPDGVLQPRLASSWEETPTSVSYTLTGGVTCSDGTPLTATDVADNFRYVADPNNQSPWLGFVVPPGVHVEADDTNRTVTLTTEQPVPYLLRTTSQLYIVCRQGLDDRNVLERGTAGTGPFVLEEAVPDDHYTYTTRDDYAWGPNGASSSAAGFPAKLVIKIIENESTAANLLLTGGANLAEIKGPDRARLEENGLLRVQVPLMYGEFFFNQTEGLPTADVGVREALVKAVDWGEVARVLTEGNGTLADGLVASGAKACPPTDLLPEILAAGPRTDEAAQLLDSSRWKAPDGGTRVRDGEQLTLRVVYSTGDEGAAPAMELIRQVWSGLGIDVQLQGLGPAKSSETVFGTRAWDVLLTGINLTYPSQFVPFMTGPVPPDGTNIADIQNPEYERLTSEAMTATGSAACEMWTAAEKALYEQMSILPFAVTTTSYFAGHAEFQLTSFAGTVDSSSLRLYKP